MLDEGKWFEYILKKKRKNLYIFGAGTWGKEIIKKECIKLVESSISNNNLVYAFEPDNSNYCKCKETLSGYKNNTMPNRWRWQHRPTIA